MLRPVIVGVLSRAILGAMFAIIALVQFLSAVRADAWAVRMHQGLSAILWTMFAVLVVIRPVPIHRASSRVGIVVALGAQSGALLLGVVAHRTDSGAPLAAGTVLLASGLLFAIASVAFLGRCFGVLPDVRGLVTRGPYSIVRHPLYLGELTALLGVAVGTGQWQTALAIWVITLLLQLARTRYEEQSLRHVFPEYASYAERTKRLIPGVV
ncbi:MAG TPA: isoprenylcysteine carboxylmethyltransferase family protein [Gaiellales bacterium]|nr:isoprenylcysteine carboxylmethyltransferase family protein [Gaiellales bacterium]